MSVKLEREFTGNHIKEIFNKLNKDRKDGNKYCDVTINADSHTFSAHKPVLVLFCEFFEKMFTSKMKENYSSSSNIHDVDHNIMEIILSYIYTEKILISKENVYDVLAAANYMQIPALLKFCGEFLNEALDLSNCVSSLAYLRMYNQNKLTGKSMKMIGENFENLVKLQHFNSLSFGDFLLVLKLKKKKYSSEIVVYEAVINWINEDADQRQAYFNELFQCIDVHKFSANFLKDVLMKQKLVMSSVECMQAIAVSAVDMTPPHEPSTSDQSQKPEEKSEQKKGKRNPRKKTKEPKKSKKELLFDQYDSKDFDNVKVVKELVEILRNGKYKELKLDKSGYCFIEDITHCKRFLDRFGKIECHEIEEIVGSDGRGKFELKRENQRIKIRAITIAELETMWGRLEATLGALDIAGKTKSPQSTSGQSKAKDVDLVEVLDPGKCDIYFSTTYFEWSSIESNGLSRSGNNYIQFIKGMNRGKMTNDNIVIKIDIEAAVKAGLKFYVHPQGGVVSKGNKNGKILPKFFLFAKDLNTNEKIFENDE